jgi:lipoate-protein ligase A
MNSGATATVRWLVLDTGPGEPAFNMALDEALMERAPQLGRPVLRFYGWTQPAATFGYFQPHAAIAVWTRLRPLIRRPTGGGLVPHDADWTYALAVPPAHEWYALSAAESYARVHEWVRDAFARLGVAGELAPCCRKTAPGQCFAGYEQSDVLWQGRKIAGAAQRRSRAGLLIQGSVQPPPLPLDRVAWQTAMREVAIGRWCAGWEELPVAGELRARAERLADEKYRRAAYNERR